MSFLAFAASHGLVIRDLIADGRVHRVPTDDHPKKRNGAYLFDGASGFVQNWATQSEAIAYRDGKGGESIPSEEMQRLARDRAARRAKEEAKARREAAEILNAAHWLPHPYLERKGFAQECGMVHGGMLIVPMWDANAYGKRLNSVQQIAPDGSKKFLYGGRAKGSIFRIGSGRELWHCEGFATGLSIRDALSKLYRKGTVVVSFSAGNLAVVAKQLGGRVVADNDESGAGERAARGSALPWVMPEAVGMDANDLHISAGIDRLAQLLRTIL